LDQGSLTGHKNANTKDRWSISYKDKGTIQYQRLNKGTRIKAKGQMPKEKCQGQMPKVKYQNSNPKGLSCKKDQGEAQRTLDS